MAVRSHRLFVFLVCLLALLPAAAFAGNTRYILVTGTSSAVGEITIETFSKPDFPRGARAPQSPASSCSPCLAHVTVPAGFNCDQTAAMLADSLSAQLPVDYTSFVHPMHPAVVEIDYIGLGTFSMNIIDTIPGQFVQEVPVGAIPTLAEWGIVLLGLTLLMSALVVIRRRAVPARRRA